MLEEKEEQLTLLTDVKSGVSCVEICHEDSLIESCQRLCSGSGSMYGVTCPGISLESKLSGKGQPWGCESV